MSKRRRKSRQSTTPASPPFSGAPVVSPTRSSGKWKFALAGLGVAIFAGALLFWQTRGPVGVPPEITLQAASLFVGSTACAGCHAKVMEAWRGSHHQLAMQEANASTVLGNFDDAKFKYSGIESRFFKRDGKFMVRTDGPDGRLADFEIKYTFGVWPLQQYLIEFPGGRYQTLGIAWDARAKGEGGQRWFHLYPGEKIDHKDQLHWTGLYQNWNLQCAACHSTNLKKGYDAASNTYKTTFNEINVACEACHGPGSRHVGWAKQARPPYLAQSDKGLMVLKSRWNEAWNLPAADAKTAQRDQPAADTLMNVCAACHARRSTIIEEVQAGAPLEETHRLALLTQPNYHADGQQRDEDYTWGSFLQRWTRPSPVSSRPMPGRPTATTKPSPRQPGRSESAWQRQGTELAVDCGYRQSDMTKSIVTERTN